MQRWTSSPIGVPGGGVWGRVKVGGGGWVCCGKIREKRKRVGRVGSGVGTRKGTGKSMRTRLSKLPFSKLPLVSPRKAVCCSSGVSLSRSGQNLANNLLKVG